MTISRTDKADLAERAVHYVVTRDNPKIPEAWALRIVEAAKASPAYVAYVDGTVRFDVQSALEFATAEDTEGRLILDHLNRSATDAANAGITTLTPATPPKSTHPLHDRIARINAHRKAGGR